VYYLFVALYRAQILLEQDQRDRLEALARQSGRSISQMVREAMTEYLSRTDQDEAVRRSLKALDELAQLRHDIQARYGLVGVSVLDDVRDERDRELEA
jgi:hypothetical protein